MSAIKFSPYIPNVEAWVEFYKNQPKEVKSFYTIGNSKQPGEEMEAIKVMSPTESVVDQARSELKREAENEEHTHLSKKQKCNKKPDRIIKPSAAKKKYK